MDGVGHVMIPGHGQSNPSVIWGHLVLTASNRIGHELPPQARRGPSVSPQVSGDSWELPFLSWQLP